METLHRYDMPLIGVVRQANDLHLFHCIEGQVDSTQVWTYTRITPQELETLRVAEPGNLDTVLDGLVVGRPTVVALADNERGLTVSALLGNTARYPSSAHAARVALAEALDDLDAKLGRSVG